MLADAAEVASGATAKAMGGVRQQFSTAAEVRLAQSSIRFFEELGAPLFEQVGYLFLATTQAGADALAERVALQNELGVPVQSVDPSFVSGLNVDDVRAAAFCAEDGVADPPAVTRELVRRAVEAGVELRERTDALQLDAETLVIACGPRSGEVASARGIELPIRPLCRQLLATAPVDAPASLPMVVEAESGFHFRRREERLVIAMTDAAPRWGFDEVVDESVFEDRLARLAHRYAPSRGTSIEHAWAGLYDMTPDVHPIIGGVGDGVYAACGFSGHGFMQSPAVGAAVASELLGEQPPFDLTPYRLERFATGAVLPETVVL